MNDLLDQIQCDELPYVPTQEDWNEYCEWLDSQADDCEETFVVVGENYKPSESTDCPF